MIKMLINVLVRGGGINCLLLILFGSGGEVQASVLCSARSEETVES